MTITIQKHGIYERRDGKIVGPAIPLEGSLTFMWKIGPRSYMNNGAFTVVSWRNQGMQNTTTNHRHG